MMMMIHCVDGRSNNFDDYNEESNGDDDNDHLYSTINCNVIIYLFIFVVTNSRKFFLITFIDFYRLVINMIM